MKLFKQAGSSEQRIIGCNEVRCLNHSFPKIDNLEYFPPKVLVTIFSNVDDTSLCHLADISYRFKDLVKMGFREKYANSYFVFDAESKREMYVDVLNHFGSDLDIAAVAVAVQGIRDIDGNHWITQLLRQYMAHPKKLRFENCSFKNAYDYLSPYIDITHLSLRYTAGSQYGEICLPKFRNLKKLELHGLLFESREMIVNVIRDNPSLESLIIRQTVPFTFRDMVVATGSNLHHLNEFALITNGLFPAVSPYCIEPFVDSLSNIESLALTVGASTTQLIKRLSEKCKRVKHLEFHVPGDQILSREFIKAVAAFEDVESFTLQQHVYNEEVDMLLRSLPNLRQLHVKMSKPNSYEYILPRGF